MPVTSIIKIIGDSMDTRTIQELLTRPTQHSSLALQEEDSIHMIMAERHKAIVEVVGKVEELHQLELELQHMVHDQGDLVDKIDQHVTKAGEYVGAGIKDLEQAAKNQRGCTLL
jgi:t-SNARE complex subunit (syntaxin)